MHDSIKHQIEMNVKWARAANHRVIQNKKSENINWDDMHADLQIRFGMMKVAKLLKDQK